MISCSPCSFALPPSLHLFLLFLLLKGLVINIRKAYCIHHGTEQCYRIVPLLRDTPSKHHSSLCGLNAWWWNWWIRFSAEGQKRDSASDPNPGSPLYLKPQLLACKYLKSAATNLPHKSEQRRSDKHTAARPPGVQRFPQIRALQNTNV